MRWTSTALLASAIVFASASASAQAPGLPRAPGMPGGASDERYAEPVPVEEGTRPPPGYHLEKRTRPGLIAGGITLLVVGLAGSGTTAAILASPGTNCAEHEGACAGAGIAMSIVGLGCSIVGGAMLAAGLAPQLYMVPGDPLPAGAFRFTPTISARPGGASLGIVASF